MKVSDVLRDLAGVADGQWGFVTTAQASVLGVSRVRLQRLADAGVLQRAAHGVYRVAGAPVDEFASLRAAWLAVDPKRAAEDRLGDRHRGFVVSGPTAAWLHETGDLEPEPFELSYAVRRQTTREGIRVRRADLSDGEVTIRHGLPVTTVERTLVDLLVDGAETGHVASVLRDAASTGPVDLDQVAEQLDARRGSSRREPAQKIVDQLRRAAGLDPDSLARRFAGTDAGQAFTRALRNRMASEVSAALAESGALEQLSAVIGEDLTAAMSPVRVQLPEPLRQEHAKAAASATKDLAPSNVPAVGQAVIEDHISSRLAELVRASLTQSTGFDELVTAASSGIVQERMARNVDSRTAAR